MFVKHYAPLSFLATHVLYNCMSQFKISFTNVGVRNLFLEFVILSIRNGFGTFDHGDIDH